MKKLRLSLMLTSLLALSAWGQDTTIVHAFSFDDPSPEGWSAPYRRVLSFPDEGKSYRQILMVQHLKCDVRTKHDTFACGEWDYHTQYTLLEPVGDTVEAFNLVSFITPYGIRLKMGGEKGWTWVYDVTDYAPLLRGEKEIIAGNNQELLDLKFFFIEGIPPRPVISVQNIYPYGNYKYEYLADDSLCKEVSIPLDPGAAGFAIKSAISGHGHAGPRNCCEWDSKTHSLYFGEEDRFRWNVWKDCGFNAIYPQGGTWPFDRAGWCPGTPVDEYWFELTPKVRPGDTLHIDYGIEMYADNGEKDGEFRMSHQLFTYGPFSYEVNVRVSDIIAPSSEDRHSRVNPPCGEAVVEIQNLGSMTLRNARIECYIQDPASGQIVLGIDKVWRGSLAPMQKTLVPIGTPDLIDYPGYRFKAMIGSANGEKPHLPHDASYSSEIPEITTLPSSIIFSLHSNDVGRARENHFTVSDGQGIVLLSGGEFTDDSTFLFPVTLPPGGCYTFRFTDDREDGISRHWWYRRSDPEKVGINGKLMITDQDGNELVSFPADFGQEILFRFAVKN